GAHRANRRSSGSGADSLRGSDEYGWSATVESDGSLETRFWFLGLHRQRHFAWIGNGGLRGLGRGRGGRRKCVAGKTTRPGRASGSRFGRRVTGQWGS